MNEPFIQVSDAVQERYDRSQFEYQRARKEWLEAWEAMQRERYQRAAMADHQFATPEMDT